MYKQYVYSIQYIGSWGIRRGREKGDDKEGKKKKGKDLGRQGEKSTLEAKGVK